MEIQLYGLDEYGLINVKELYRNLSVPSLVEHVIKADEALLSSNGALVLKTGKRTGRSPNDKFFVKEPSTEDEIDWGKVQLPTDERTFDNLLLRMLAYMQGKDIYLFDGFVGADERYRLPLRVVTGKAWAALFSTTLFIPPTSEELFDFVPAFSIYHAPGYNILGERDHLNSEVAIIIHFAKRIIMIAGTGYAGELKKSIFTIMNFLLPKKQVFPMHCAANMGKKGDVALFFGLSGTGKTTLSSDPNRKLIGDDEHGWSNEGVFNIEGGCYAKCAKLSEQAEPHIFHAIRYGSLVENVVMDPDSRKINWDDLSITENTRATYPLGNVPNAIHPSMGGHPKNIIFLTADAFGILPPVAKLTTDQALYHFLSGYTAKIAGTEAGVKEPNATFSALYGEPFFPMHPVKYAALLKTKLNKYKSQCWLVNTGWTGGMYGEGERISLVYTRAILDLIFSGELAKAQFKPDPIFNILVPKAFPKGKKVEIPDSILHPRETWEDAERYDQKAKELAMLFKANFTYFENDVEESILKAGPNYKG